MISESYADCMYTIAMTAAKVNHHDIEFWFNVVMNVHNHTSFARRQDEALMAQYPGFTIEQIKAGLSVPAAI